MMYMSTLYVTRSSLDISHICGLLFYQLKFKYFALLQKAGIYSLQVKIFYSINTHATFPACCVSVCVCDTEIDGQNERKRKHMGP